MEVRILPWRPEIKLQSFAEWRNWQIRSGLKIHGLVSDIRVRVPSRRPKKMRMWWNWQSTLPWGGSAERREGSSPSIRTSPNDGIGRACKIQILVPKGVWVRVPLRAPAIVAQLADSRQTQNLLAAGLWGFESLLWHQDWEAKEKTPWITQRDCGEAGAHSALKKRRCRFDPERSHQSAKTVKGWDTLNKTRRNA